jgi:hypothetical protein
MTEICKFELMASSDRFHNVCFLELREIPHRKWANGESH